MTRRRILQLFLHLAAGLAAAALACGPETDAPRDSDWGAPVTPHATLLLSPEVLHIGEIVTAEIAVVAPPETRLLAVPAQQIEGLALLGAQELPPEQDEHRWVHRTRYRMRPDAIGEHVWPSLELELERADGTIERLELAERRFEVASMRDRFPGRDQPFGLEEPEPVMTAPGSPGFVTGLALGVLLSALAAGFVWGVRAAATRRRQSRRIPVRTPGRSLFDWTEHELGEALDALEADPRQAASVGAHLLRVYVARRFGSETEAATTEELERRTPALAERSLWPDFVRILHSFDDERFRPEPEGARAPRDARIRSALEDSRRLIETSRPSDAAGSA